MSIYGRLGFNSADPTTAATVTNYNSGVANNMAIMPALLPHAWQIDDVSSSNVGSYFVNPVYSSASTILNVTGYTYAVINNYGPLTVSSNVIANYVSNAAYLSNIIYTTTAPNYIYVTNRESNVVGPGTDSTTVHYQMAMGYGKILSYLTYQSDGVQNNSPIMGNFTSITLGNTLSSLSSSLITYYNSLAGSISITSNGSGGYANTSNISLSNAQGLSDTVNTIYTLMTTYPAQDNAFFTNSKSVVADYTEVSRLGDLGSTENYLVNNYIGTDKLKTRLSSQ
jgi:hypothetical protein